jgi:DNA processing protein
MHSYINPADKNYPKNLLAIPKPPSLYIRGNIAELNERRWLGVVGTRKMSSYGMAVLQRIIPHLDKSSIVLVSGFMRGVDHMAHQLALENNIPTVAVLPCGFDAPFNFAQRSMSDQIVSNGGAILTEYPPEKTSRDWMFVQRNRIVAGLSEALLVVEAADGSGSLITSDFAKKYKRTLMAVPGDIFRDLSQGTSHLLAHGALAVCCAEDVHRSLGLNTHQPLLFDVKDANLSPEENQVLGLLREQAMDVSSLCQKLTYDISHLQSLLCKMEMDNMVKELKGVYYAC